jgi:tRNA(Ile)-lysidine synthase TilS/MesJ
MLMRLLRGASVRGMSAMAWRRTLQSGSNIQLIRPMLSVDRATAKQFLDSLGQTWREDRTNADTTRLRAQLREQVLPTLRAVQSDVSDRAVKLADHLRDVAQLVEEAVEAAAEKIDSTINRAEAREMPRVVLFGLLRKLLIETGVPADRLGGRIINPIVRAIRDHTGGHRTFELSKGIHMEITRESVTIESS